MTLPKGYSSGGKRVDSGNRDEIERMIGRRVEHMNGVYVLGFILCWVGTIGGIYVGVTVYPWAYPLPSGMFAGSVLTVIEVLGLIFIIKVANEKPMRP